MQTAPFQLEVKDGNRSFVLTAEDAQKAIGDGSLNWHGDDYYIAGEVFGLSFDAPTSVEVVKAKYGAQRVDRVIHLIAAYKKGFRG